MRMLLVQIRDREDPMGPHEVACVQRRLGDRSAELVVVNPLAGPSVPTSVAGFDAVVIGGSGQYSVYHPESVGWVSQISRLLDAALDAALPGFGICFGHQLLGFHFGAQVETSAAHTEIGTVEVELTDAGRTDPLFGTLEPVFTCVTGHSDHVVRVPAELEVLASNEVIHTQAFRVRGTQFYSTQFHPDMTGAEARARYLACQERLSGVTEEATTRGASRFQLEANQAEVLLSRFVDLVG